MTIYKITNLINGKVYIGATIQTLLHRKAGHLYDSKRYNGSINKAIRKHGIDNFKFQILEIVSNKELMYEREQYYIKLYDSMNNGYNMTSGGLYFTGSDEYRYNLTGKNNGMYGKHHSKETIEKYSKVRSGKNHWLYNKHHTKESNEKNRIAHLGKKHSNETKKRMSIAQKKRLKQKANNNL